MENRGDFSLYNDYELLYLISMNIDEAKDILFWKYSFLIKSRIYRLGVPRNLWDDYYQEGCLMLYRAIKIFDDNSQMTFTNFFELILKRRIITLLRKTLKDNKIEKINDFDAFQDNYVFNNQALFEDYDYGFTEMEKIVYKRIILYNEKIDIVASDLGVNSKSVSNAKQRVLKKIRREINK